MFGRTFLGNNQILPTMASFDNSPKYKPGGITMDWATVSSSGGNGSSSATLTDGSVIYDNVKYLRFGQIVTKITSSGKYGPYDPNATDGRQTLTRGEAYIVNHTVTQYASGIPQNSAVQDQIGDVFDEGTVYADRILHSGTVTASIPLGPTLANFNTVFPRVGFISSGRIVP